MQLSRSPTQRSALQRTAGPYILAHFHRSAAMQQAREQSGEKETRDGPVVQQPFSSLVDPGRVKTPMLFEKPS